MHPNLKGHGIIAQDIYNAVALSPEAIKKIESIRSGKD